jgi:hypothetical protein
MLKKTLFLYLSMMPVLLWASKPSDQEQLHFSEMDTIKTWVASRYHADPDKMNFLQSHIEKELPNNRFASKFCHLVKNNDGDQRIFGKTIYALEASQLPFLQFVHQISRNKSPLVLEIAAAHGYVTWKIPYAFEQSGTVYANDLSSVMLSKRFMDVLKPRVDETLRKLVHTLPGDCLNLVSEHPELIGMVDAIYVQRLEIFFNPKEHQQFLTVLETLLTQNGRAFLVSEAPDPSFYTSKNPAFTLDQMNESTAMYPAFLKYTMTYEVLNAKFQVPGSISVSEAIRPPDTTPCSTTLLESVDAAPLKTLPDKQTTQRATITAVALFFTPLTYKNAIISHQSLNIVETFFMGEDGCKKDTASDERTRFVVAIIEKVSQ